MRCSRKAIRSRERRARAARRARFAAPPLALAELHRTIRHAALMVALHATLDYLLTYPISNHQYYATSTAAAAAPL